jgi:hypothetical protein
MRRSSCRFIHRLLHIAIAYQDTKNSLVLTGCTFFFERMNIKLLTNTDLPPQREIPLDLLHALGSHVGLAGILLLAWNNLFLLLGQTYQLSIFCSS